MKMTGKFVQSKGAYISMCNTLLSYCGHLLMFTGRVSMLYYYKLLQQSIYNLDNVQILYASTPVTASTHAGCNETVRTQNSYYI